MVLTPRTNYALIEKSDFARTIVTEYIIKLNMDKGLHYGPSLFADSIVVSDTDTPNDRKIVLAYKERGNFHTIELDKDFIPVFAQIIGIQSPDFLKFCRTNLGKKQPDLAYYYMTVLASFASNDDGSLNPTKAAYVIDKYKYKGVS